MANASLQELIGVTAPKQTKAPKDSSAPAAEPPRVVHQFRRNIFRNETGTGVNVHKETAKIEPGIKTEFVSMDERITQEYRNFLSNYTQNLIEIVRSGNAAVLRTPEHQKDRRMLELLGKTTSAADFNSITEVDSSKIDKFLSSPQGWIIATQIMEEQASLELFALGLDSAVLPPGARDDMPETVTVNLGVDEGVLRKGLDKIGDFLRKRVDITGDRPNPSGALAGMRRWGAAGWLSFGTVTGALIGNATGGPLGGAIGGLSPVATTAFVRALRSGVQLNVRQCADILGAIQARPEEVEYIRHMTQIDIRNFVINGNNQIERAPLQRGVLDAAEARQEVVRKLYTRMEFYTKIGVPLNKLDAIPEQFLYRFVGREDDFQPEQTETRWAERAERAFQDLGGVVDNGGNGPGDPGFDPNNLNYEENYRRYMQSRRDVMTGMITEYIDWERSKSSSLQDAISTIGAKAGERKTGGKLTKERIDAINKEKDNYQKDKTYLDGKKNNFDSYKNIISELDRARELLGNLLGTLAIGGGGVFPDAQAAIIALRSLSTTAGVSVVIDGQTLTSIFSRESAARTALETSNSGIAGTPRNVGETDILYTRRLNVMYDRVKAEYEAKLKEFQPDIEKINQTIAELQRLQGEIKTKQASMEEASPSIVSVTRDFENIESDFNALIAGAGITEARLRTENIDQLMRRINARARGLRWPENENGYEEHRQTVLNAMVEARAREIDALDPAHAGRIADFGALKGWGLTENQLRTLTVNEIHSLINKINTADPTKGWGAADNAVNADRITRAAAEAKLRLSSRTQSLDEKSKASEDLRKRSERRASGVEFPQEVNRLETTLDLLRRQPEIFSESGRVEEDIDRFTNVTVVTAAETTYTQAERDAGLATGYYELMNFLFAYQGRADRQEYFRKIQDLLPPQKFAEIMNDTLGILVSPPPVAVDAFLTALNAQVAAGVMETMNIRQGFRDVLNRLRDEALAI